MDSDKPKRRAHNGTNAEHIQMNVPIPRPGETLTLEVPRYNLTLLIERGANETQEQKRGRYTPVAPIAPDRRLHAARLGVGALKAKRMAVTLCAEDSPADKVIKSGSRIDISLDAVTCAACARTLSDEGVELTSQEGNGS